MKIKKLALLYAALTLVSCGGNSPTSQDPQELGWVVAKAHLEDDYEIIDRLLAIPYEIESVFGSLTLPEISIGSDNKMDRTQFAWYRASPRQWFDIIIKPLRFQEKRSAKVQVIAQTDRLACIRVFIQTSETSRGVSINVFACRVERGWVILYMV
ncbi:MAG: hypothetical protein JXA73_00435 [Acidobacteria bacterium]|nr:hypothetical protein [Acidobacteriota bacterium]